MAWSFSVGRIAGSDVRIHITFFLLLAWIGLANYQKGGIDVAIESIAFIIAIFACVLAHEFGHILTARRYGIRAPVVTLLPIGGVASLERMPEKPAQEILVALAGPAVNFVIAFVLIILVGTSLDPASLNALENPEISFAARLAAVNVFIAVFNLLPAFPMDGGRVFRALLSLRYSRSYATTVAAKTGQMLAFLFGFLGLAGGNPLLIFIAIFVYLAATAEEQATIQHEVAADHLAEDAMITRFKSLAPGETIEDATRALLETTQVEFPILDGNDKFLGMLTRTEMIKALTEAGTATPLEKAMEQDIPVCRKTTKLTTALQMLQDRTKPAVAVVDRDNRFQGYITLENFAELLLIEQAVPKTP
ncbi:MAG: site-2 protease family protein [Methyloligellaceae bacterium]